MVLEGECEVKDIYLREYAAPDVWTAHFNASDAGLNELFAAGRETYRANAVDFLPTRHPASARDGFAIAHSLRRCLPLLSGHSVVEKWLFRRITFCPIISLICRMG